MGYKTRMIDLASEINTEMPAYVVSKVADALNGDSRAVRGSRIVVLGIAYKRNIDDMRESPALDIIRLLQNRGALVEYHDPFCPVIADDGHTSIKSLPMHSVALDAERLGRADCVVIVTDHTAFDFDAIGREARLVVDTRGVMRGRTTAARVVGLSGKAEQSTR